MSSHVHFISYLCLREEEKASKQLFICGENFHESIYKHDDIAIDMLANVFVHAVTCFPAALTFTITVIYVFLPGAAVLSAKLFTSWIFISQKLEVFSNF